MKCAHSTVMVTGGLIGQSRPVPLRTMARCWSHSWSAVLGVLVAAMLSWLAEAHGQVFFEPPTSVSVGINFQPSVATDGAGNWVLVWDHIPDDYKSPSATPTSVSIARSADNGATWSTAETLASDAEGAQVATDGAGTWVAVWSGAAGRIEMAQSTDNGRTWRARAAFGSGEQPQVATDGAGHWVAVWTTLVSTSWTVGGFTFPRLGPGDIVVARSADNGLTWTAPAPLDASGATRGLNSHVATDRAGVWVAVWDTCLWDSGAGLDEGDVWFARSNDAGASWTTPALLSNDAGTLQESMPRLATDAKGNWIVAWRAMHYWQPDLPVQTDLDILAVRSKDNGLTWTTPAWLNTSAAVDRTDQMDDSPSLATDGKGVWLATWDWYDAYMGFHALVAQSTDNGASWTPPTLINPNQDFPTTEEQEPEVASDGAGHWVVAWVLDSPNAMIAARGSTCGNGIVEFGKQCDDGNRTDGDGCSSTCQSEMLAGNQLVLSTVATSNMRLLSHDAAIALGRGNLSSDDPVAHGGTARVFSTAGDGFDATYELPAADWQYIGWAGANRGYRYSRQTGLIASAVVKSGQLKLELRDTQLARLLGQNPDPVHVVLTMGTRTYQLSFGGTVTFRARRLYRARHAPAPSVEP
jgi:cysteine-rich repeat protein